MQEMFHQNLAKRGVELGALEYKAPQKAMGESIRQPVALRQGINADLAKKIDRALFSSW